MGSTSALWFIWALSTAAGAAILLAGMLYGGSVRSYLLVGRTTSGHHQIELACDACHTRPFGGGPVLQAACLACHGEDLKAAKDTHPAKKFTDPRNADRLEKLEARLCVTCHREHRPEITHAMGLTLPPDYCALCHKDIASERPSHVGLGFDTCASAGCHKYHDNRALYEDYLAKRSDEPDVRAKPIAKLRLAINEPAERRTPLGRAEADAPADKLRDSGLVGDWAATAHAKAGVNCSGCHTQKNVKGGNAGAPIWISNPDHGVCGQCHSSQAKTFTQGKHGMRLAPGLRSSTAGLFGIVKEQALSPMRPELARLPMAKSAHRAGIGCTTCHGAHAFDVTQQAQVEACLGCHADEHSRGYLGSPHHRLWQAELAGTAAKGSGVSCATCHLPRYTVEDDSGLDRVVAHHNQNDNLRPSEKMVRSVCGDCHGLRFTLDALADKGLARRNYAGRPTVSVPSIDWALKRLKERRAHQ